MDQYYGAWVPYSGNSAILLGVVLLVIAGIFTFLGILLINPLKVKTPGKAVTGMLLVFWILSILTWLVNSGIYSLLLSQSKFTGTLPANPITKFTISFAFLSFSTIFIINAGNGQKAAFLGGVLAAMAGPMIFELPFDLIVISRTYPPIPPDPRVLRTLFFFPLFLIELTTITLMFCSPLFNVNKFTLFSIAGMFLVFAIWAFLSFSYPYTTKFIILNVTAKAMAFVTVVTLFLPEKKLTDQGAQL